MSRTLRIVLIIVGLLVVLIIVAPFLIPVNQFRPTIEEKASAALGRKVDVGNLSLSLFTGSVAADNLAIADDAKFSQSPFLTAKSVRVGVELIPLILSKQLNITGITIDSPEVTLIRDPHGEWNYSSFGTSAAKSQAAQTPAATPPPAQPSGSTSSSSNLSDGIRSLSKSIEHGQSVLDLIRSHQQAKVTVGLNSKNVAKMAESIKESRQKAKDEKKKRDAEWIARADALRGVSRLVPGEGSGLKGIGVQGKDHAPAHGEMMVDSEDDDESEGDESDSKALLSKSKEKSKKVLEYEESRKRAMLQKQQGPVKKTKIIRSAKDMRGPRCKSANG